MNDDKVRRSNSFGVPVYFLELGFPSLVPVQVAAAISMASGDKVAAAMEKARLGLQRVEEEFDDGFEEEVELAGGVLGLAGGGIGRRGEVGVLVWPVLVGSDFAILLLFSRESTLGNEKAAREVGIDLLGRAPASLGNIGEDGVCLGGFCGLGVVVAGGGGGLWDMGGVGSGPWGNDGGGTLRICSRYVVVGRWRWKGGVARMLGKEWECSWDIGWRREGPKVMVGGEGGGSGGPLGPIG